jgi:hypothetical protein
MRKRSERIVRTLLTIDRHASLKSHVKTSIAKKPTITEIDTVIAVLEMSPACARARTHNGLVCQALLARRLAAALRALT